MRFRREDIHQAVFDLLTEHLLSETAIRRGRAYIESVLRERQSQEDAAVRGAADGKEIKRLNEQAAALRGMNLPPSALSAALTAIEREREEIYARASGKHGQKEHRAERLIARVDEITDTYKRLVGEAVKALAKPEVVEAAGKPCGGCWWTGGLPSSRTRAVPGWWGRYTSRNSRTTCWNLPVAGGVQAGCRRRCNLLNSNEKSSGSGAVLPIDLPEVRLTGHRK